MIPEISQLPLIFRTENDVHHQHHCRDHFPPDRYCSADMIGEGAFPGSSGRAQQDPPEATGEADGGQWGQLGDLAMEAEEIGVCSFFEVALLQSPSSPHCRCCPHRGTNRPCCRQVGSRSCSSQRDQNVLETWAYRGASASHPQCHQVGGDHKWPDALG
jgi:hypothetical protein